DGVDHLAMLFFRELPEGGHRVADVERLRLERSEDLARERRLLDVRERCAMFSCEGEEVGARELPAVVAALPGVRVDPRRALVSPEWKRRRFLAEQET